MAFYRFRMVIRSFMQDEGLPFSQALPETVIQQAFADEGVDFGKYARHLYTPALAVWAFLSQIGQKKEHRSCRAAVRRCVVMAVLMGRPYSFDTGAYCRARAKLPVIVMQRLALELAERAEGQVPPGWLWRMRNVLLVDGFTSTMEDTAANQKTYPQPQSQKPGLGFPIMRVVVLISLATAMVNGMAMGPYAGKESGETALFRSLFSRLRPGDVVLGDRYYCSYFMIALLMEAGVDVVTRLHQRRRADFRRGQRLGNGDHIVIWTRPDRPAWMDEETYARMPETLQVREVRVRVHQRGFRVESLVVVTTLTDAQEYSRADVAELYHRRWLVELDIRSIKISLGLDELRCKSPEMARREMWVGMLAYNLIRLTMLQAAAAAKCSPRQLSFTAALQTVVAFYTAALLVGNDVLAVLTTILLHGIGIEVVGDRPDRVEPRAVKRRPKPHPRLMRPRAEAKAVLLG